jgi:hypothetical protein
MNERGMDDDVDAAEEDDSSEDDSSEEDDATYNSADMERVIVQEEASAHRVQ